MANKICGRNRGPVLGRRVCDSTGRRRNPNQGVRPLGHMRGRDGRGGEYNAAVVPALDDNVRRGGERLRDVRWLV